MKVYIGFYRYIKLATAISGNFPEIV